MSLRNMYSFVITGRIPSKKNSRVTNRKTGRSFPSRDYTKWHKNAAEQLENFYNEEIDFPVEVSYKFYMPDLRPTDISNKLESINDLLTDINFWKDDNWSIVRKFHASAELDRENPRVEITVNEL